MSLHSISRAIASCLFFSSMMLPRYLINITTYIFFHLLKGRLSTHFSMNSDKKSNVRSSPPEVFLEIGILKICSKLTGEHPCRSVISKKLFCNFIEITLWHGCSPVNCCIFSEHLFLGTSLEGCFSNFQLVQVWKSHLLHILCPWFRALIRVLIFLSL